MKTKRRSLEKAIEGKIPFVHSLLRALGEEKLTKEKVYENYKKLRPGSMIKKIFTPPVDIGTVDVYLKTLTDYEYINQEVAPWSENGKAQVLLYSIGQIGRDFLNGTK